MSFDFRKWIKYIQNSKIRFRFTVGSLILSSLLLFALVYTCSSSEKKIAKTSYTIARDLNWAPLQLMGKERNMRAFSDELILAIANKMHLKVVLVPAIYSNLMDGLDEEKYDGVFSVLLPNVVNQTHYFFSDPYYLLGPVLVVPQSSTITSLEQMKGKIIGIQNGSSSIYNVEHYPSILILPYDNMSMALNDLANNKIDGVIMESWPAHVYIESFYKDQLKIVTSPLTNTGLRLVTLRKPEYRHLIESFNEGLIELKKEGEYDRILNEWGLFNSEIKPTPKEP
jgi:polar amino acid transport system substrate-binding protein